VTPPTVFAVNVFSTQLAIALEPEELPTPPPGPPLDPARK
jgi:hypothetical protein